MLDNIEKNTEDQTDPFAKYGGKKVVKNEDPFAKYGGSILKKKGSSQPTSQEKQQVSSAQQKERLISAVTGQQPDQQASAGLNGEPKIGTFTGFTPGQLKSMKAPEPGYMAPKENKELEKLKPYIKKTQLKKELAKTKVTAENQEAVLSKIQEIDKLEAQTKQIEKERLDRIEQDFVKSKDSEYAEAEADKRLNDLLSNTGVWNNVKSTAKDLYNTALSSLSKSSPLSAGLANLTVNTDPLAEEKKQIISQASKEKVDLSENEVLEKAKQLFKDKQIDNIETDRVNSFLDNLPEADKEALKQDRYNTSVHLQEENAKNEKAINAYSTIGNKKIEEYKNIENQLKSFKERGIQFPEDLYNKYTSLSSEIKNISENIQKRQDLLIKNNKDLGTVNQEFDLLKRQYGDVENFILKTGIAARELGVGIISGLDYLGSQTSPYAKASSIGLQSKLMDINKGLEEERENLRKSVESVESVEGFVNYASDIVANQIPSLVATSTGIGGLGVIGVSGAGQKYTEMNQEVLEGKASYSPEQMALAPLFYGSAEVVSEIPTLSILKKGGRVLDAVAKNQSELLTKTAIQKGKEFAKDFAEDQIKEGAGEQFTNFAQNVNDKFLLGKKDVGLLDNTGTVFKDTFLLTGMLKAAPHLAGLAIKPFQSNTDLNVLDENSRKILQFSRSLNTLDLSEDERSVIQKQIDKATSDNSKIIANTIDRISNMPDEAYLKVNELNKKAAQIKDDARVVNDGNLPNKDTILKDLENQYRDVQIERSDLINAKYNKVTAPTEVTTPVVEEIKTTQPVITAETSSNFANMTQDGEGNFVFYHVSPTTLDVIDPSKYGSNAGNVTSRDEKAAIGRVGGVAMFYTDPNDSESMVNGNKHVVKVPESEVYDFNSDPNNFYDEAEKQFKEANPNMAFSPNDQFAWITKVAGDNGYKMVVGEWGNGKTRAQTTQKLTPVDVMEVSGNTVTKPFEKEYVGNREKGFKSVIPKSKQSKISEAKEAIRSFRSQAANYDELYQAVNFSRPNMTDEEIKKLVDESDIPQELKDQYNEAMAYEPGKRRTEAPKGDVGRRIEEIKADPENEFGETFDPNGKVYDVKDQDDIVTLASENVKPEDLNEDRINQFKEKYKDIIDNVKDAKVGVFRLANGDYSIDLNTVVDSKYRENTLKFARDNNQESIYNGKEGEIKTGGNGDTVLKDKQDLIDAANKIANGESYEVKTKTTEIDAELDALQKLFDESEQGGKVTDKQIENGKKAIENIVPDVEWIIHDTNESMMDATGSTNKGAYIMTKDKDGNVKKVIHINKASADGTTVAHEVFHAVLLEKVLNDADAQDLTRRMMKAVSKTASPELKRELDEFARNYDENIRDEEKLAQLIGILAKNYDQLSQPNKTIIKKWLDKLAKMFGLKPFTNNEVIDLLNTIAGKTAIGDVITEKDVDILNSGVSTYISEPVEIKKFQSKNEKKVKVGDHKLSFVKKSDIIDLNSLMKDISDKKQKVWFWVADQLGRGNYYDEVIDGEHYLDAGPSFALDPVNRDKNIIWATGKNEKEITKLIGNSDYIFIISGSPLKSKLFNKRIIDIVSKRAGDFDVFKKEVLDSSKIKSLNDILSSVNSWNELRDSTKRKEFLLELSNQQQKNTPLKKVLEKYNAIVDLNELRDGFYADNNFDLNDIMLVLKPTEYGGKSDHSTYENNILGDVVGVPDIKVNAFDIMPSELKDKYKEVLSKTQQQAAVAPYGIGVRTIERSQVVSNTIGDYVRIAKANNFSDEAIKKFLKSKGFSDTEIDAAMSARITSTGRPSVNNIYNQSKKAIEDRKKRASIKDLLPYLRKSLLDRQSYIKRLINKIDNKSAKKTYDLLVTKAGASALASERFKRAEKEIYGGLSSDDVNILDKMIYAKRIIAVNENRAKLGMEPYTGMDGYSMDDARQDLSDFKELLGADKYNDLSNRATSYFDVFKTNLKKLYESGRISKEVYESLKDTEYSPIKTIKYIIGDNLTIDEIDTQAKSLGISRKDIMKLSDSNENEIILDSKWLLAMNISSVEGRAFENNMLREFDRAINAATPEEKKALEDFILENPVVGTKKDGSPKYKYDDAKLPVGYVKVSYFDNGNKREIVIKDEYAKQLLDVKNKNKALETLGALTGTKILRFFATGGNPLFIIGNTAVDFQNIAFFSDVYSKFKPLATVQLIRDYTKNFIKKIVVSNQYNKVFNEYINHGGALDYMASDGLRALESMNPIKGATKAAQKGLIAYGRAMAFLGETSEVAFRLSVYDKVKNDSIKEFKKENNREPNAQELDDIMWKAARESRETMDFSQGGDVAKNIDAVFPYFNAALQGIRRPIDFAKKDPVGFSSSVLQYTAMAASLAAGSFAMLIKAVRDDEDNDKEANKKILEALNSLSEYEKANYHVIFTGNKNKDGEYEYYRVKKLPVLSVISTVAEQLIYKEFFNSEGIDYDMDSEAMMEAVSKSNPLPVTVQEVAAKNPVASGLVSYWANKDTFTGDKIFREPNNKKIMPEAEGMFDDRVAQIYKDLAPGFGLSPARTQVMFEKVITSGNTNPTIPLIYSAYDGIFNNNDGLGSEVQAAMSSVGDAFGKKLVRHTDKNIIRYKKQDDMEYQESVIETDVWKNEQKVYDEIRSRYEDKNPLTTEELINIVEKNFDPVDHKKYAKKYNAYIQNMNVDKSVLDIIFEDVPEVQAMKLNQRYGPNLEDDELQELYEAMDGAGKRVNKKAIYIYNEKYKNRKD